MDRFFYRLESLLKRQVSRRKWFKICFGALLVLISQSRFLKLAFAKTGESSGRVKRGIKGVCDLAVAEGSDSFKNTVKAIEAIGGMERFVKEGATVVVKPNMGWDRTPEQAANTDPQVVAALVELCFKAGAKKVNIFDVPCNDERRVHESSGIAKAAREKGADVYFVDHWNVVKAKFPYKSSMESWPILRDAVICDTFINVPVLKHHSLAGLTISMKNLMGVCSGQRGLMHMGLGGKLADLTDYINPELTVVDATRVLVRNGPSGGDLGDVITMNKVIAGTDPVLTDAYGASLLKKDPLSLSYIKEAVERGLGSADLVKANILTVKS